LSSKTFREDFPELLKHMSEYGPERVPRMMARNSQILDLNKASLEDLCEASQVQVYELYQLMIQSMQENFPVCGGVMPWVFKRPWVTVGIQTVDGDDRPGFGYYAVKNSYSPINVCWCQEWSVLAPYEEISLKVKVFNQNNDDLSDCVVSLKVLGPDMTEFTACVSPYNEKCDFGKIALTDEFTNKCFLVYADIHRGKETISRSVYFNKCTDLLSKQDVYEKYRTTPAENLYFKNGPWLKPCVEQAKQADISAMVLKRGLDGQYHYADVLIKNNSKIPAYPVTIDVCDDEQRCMLSDNFFLLEGNEERIVRVTADKGVVGDILISLWNGRDLVVS
jgi:beta-mannosidase